MVNVGVPTFVENPMPRRHRPFGAPPTVHPSADAAVSGRSAAHLFAPAGADPVMWCQKKSREIL